MIYDVPRPRGSVPSCISPTNLLQRFKQRYEIANHGSNIKDAGVGPKLISDGQETAAVVMKDYPVTVFFSMDENGLFYRVVPDKYKIKKRLIVFRA